MAQKVVVQLVDDLDGSQSDDIGTVTFGLDGVTYEIDLTDANASILRKQLAEFVTHARRTGGRVKRGASAPLKSPGMPPDQAQAVREWARQNGYEVSSRGRLAASIIEAFDAAQKEAVTTTRRRKAKVSA